MDGLPKQYRPENLFKKEETPQEIQEEAWYFFWKHGFTFKDLDEMPIPYATSIIKKHKEYLDKKEKMRKKKLR